MPIGSAKVWVDIGVFLADADDANDEPDETPLTATLTLTPMILDDGEALVYDNAGVGELKLIAPIVVSIGPNGQINHQGRDYVKVIAPTSIETNIGEEPLQYRADFTDVRYGNARVKLKSIHFDVQPGTSCPA